MSKTITLFLTTGPYAGENTHTSIRIAETALEQGHMNFRRAAKDDFLDGTTVGSLRGLFATMGESDVWLTLGI